MQESLEAYVSPERRLLMGARNVIGLGTGRCGTRSLAHLLNSQPNSYVTHERFRWRVPWEKQKGIRLANLVIEGCRQKDSYFLTGEVGFYWYSYVGYFMQELDNLRFVVMRREREKVVDSYMRISPERNHWQEFDEPHPQWHHDKFDHCYPTIVAESKREALERYYYGYYSTMEEYQKIFPSRLRIFHTDTLNSREGQDRILAFVGVPEDRRTYEIGIRLNQTVDD